MQAGRVTAYTPRMTRAHTVVALLCGALACAPATRMVREPTWSGTPAARGTPSYSETLEVVQFLFEEYPHGVRQRVTSPAPCVLRVVRSDDFSRYPQATVGSLYQSTWVDLSRVTDLHAKTFGREPGPGPSLVATCAWFAGEPGFALWTEIVKPVRRTSPVQDAELLDEANPRICIGSDARADRLAEPLRHLVELCGGRAGKKKAGATL